MAGDVQTIANDPDFHALPLDQRAKVISSIDPDFAGLPDVEQRKAVSKMQQDFNAAHPPAKEEQPSTLSRLASGIGAGTRAMIPSLEPPDNTSVALSGLGPLPNMARGAYAGYKQARAEGQPIGSSLASGLGSAVGLDAPGIRERAAKGDVAGVIGEGVPAIAATLAGGELHRAMPKINEIRQGLAENVVSPLTYEGVGETGTDVRQGINPERGIVQEGLTGTKKGLVKKAGQRVSELKTTADQILKNHPNGSTHLDVNPHIDAAVDNAINKSRKVAGATERLENLRTALKTEYGSTSGTPLEMNDLATKIQGAASDMGAYKNTQPIEASIGSALSDAARRIRGNVNELVPDVESLNQRMADLLDARSGITRRINAERGQSMFGSFGRGLASSTLNDTLGSAPVRTGVARALNFGNTLDVPTPPVPIRPNIRGLLPESTGTQSLTPMERGPEGNTNSVPPSAELGPSTLPQPLARIPGRSYESPTQPLITPQPENSGPGPGQGLAERVAPHREPSTGQMMRTYGSGTDAASQQAPESLVKTVPATGSSSGPGPAGLSSEPREIMRQSVKPSRVMPTGEKAESSSATLPPELKAEIEQKAGRPLTDEEAIDWDWHNNIIPGAAEASEGDLNTIRTQHREGLEKPDPARYAPKQIVTGTDALGRYAEGPNKVKMYPPKSLDDADIENWAKNKWQEQLDMQKAITDKTPKKDEAPASDDVQGPGAKSLGDKIMDRLRKPFVKDPEAGVFRIGHGEGTDEPYKLKFKTGEPTEFNAYHSIGDPNDENTVFRTGSGGTFFHGDKFGNDYGDKGTGVEPVRLKFKNPLVIKGSQLEAIDELNKFLPKNKNWIDVFNGTLTHDLDKKSSAWKELDTGIANAARAKGHDGIIYTDQMWTPHEYVALDDEAIKYENRSKYPGPFKEFPPTDGPGAPSLGDKIADRLRKPFVKNPEAGVLKVGNKGVPDEGESGPKNTATFNGKPFWSGVYDARDGSIDEVHPYETAENHDFHHSMYMSPEAQIKMREGDAGFFWVDEKGRVNTHWTAGQAPAKIEKAIQDQIKFRDVKGHK